MLDGIIKDCEVGRVLRLVCLCEEFRHIARDESLSISRCACGGWRTDQELGKVDDFDSTNHDGANSVAIDGFGGEFGVISPENIFAMVCTCGAIEFAVFKADQGFEFTCCRCGHPFEADILSGEFK